MRGGSSGDRPVSSAYRGKFAVLPNLQSTTRTRARARCGRSLRIGSESPVAEGGFHRHVALGELTDISGVVSTSGDLHELWGSSDGDFCTGLKVRTLAQMGFTVALRTVLR